VPYVLVSASHTVNRFTGLSVSYSHSQDVAVGVGGLITVDRLSGSAAMRSGRFWEFTAGAAIYRNILPGSEMLAYDVSGSIGRHLTDTLWLVGSVNRTVNASRAGTLPEADTTYTRNVVTISLRYTPFTPRTQ
jgi:hypothetical protein